MILDFACLLVCFCCAVAIADRRPRSSLTAEVLDQYQRVVRPRNRKERRLLLFCCWRTVLLLFLLLR